MLIGEVLMPIVEGLVSIEGWLVSWWGLMSIRDRLVSVGKRLKSTSGYCQLESG